MDIYLDNSATTRPDDDVTELMKRIATDVYGNPSSIHKKGSEAERVLKAARLSLLESLCGNTETANGSLIFTSGGTESNNLAVKGYFAANPRKTRVFITTKTEHASIIQQIETLARMGVETYFIDNGPDGKIDAADLAEKISKSGAGLVSIMAVNNEIGTVQPLDEAVRVIKRSDPGAAVHVDAVQAFGKIPVDPKRLGADMMSVCAHKIHGPRGIGALYVRSGVRLAPILDGGGQENGLRSGTENVAGAAAFALAASKYVKALQSNLAAVSDLRQTFLNGLDPVYTMISPDDASPYIISLSYPGLKSETILHKLETEGVYASSGSACHARNKAASHVLKAIGLPDDVLGGTVRISFSTSNTKEDAAAAAKIMNKVASELYAIKNTAGRRAR